LEEAAAKNQLFSQRYMAFIIPLFWISLSVLFFCYAGYGLLIFAWNRVKGLARASAGKHPQDEWPTVTIVIAAHNERLVLDQKLTNTLAIEYPAGKLQIMVVTDGSTDGSETLAAAYPGTTWLHESQRKGKFAAIVRAMREVRTELVVFSDANTLLNKECILRMAAHFSDKRTGGVAGEKRIMSNDKRSAVGEAEGLYWRYESFMKKQDADFFTVVGAAGELFGIRASLFREEGQNIILDDFIISMRICLQGYKIDYEPAAFATESPSASLGEEAKRKIRISAGAYQSIGYLKACLNLFKHPLLGFQYISRRLLRWVFCPWLLLVLLFANILIAREPASAQFYIVFLYVQLFFYLLAIVGGLLLRAGKRAGILAVPFYFLFMNYCLVRGFIRFLRDGQTPLWERSARQPGF
jgi:poly-beta-1,6-N-acetyl-D-glucosamine synthase